MSTASDILSSIWTKGSTHEYNYCNSLSSSLSTGMHINLESDYIIIDNPDYRIPFKVTIEDTSYMSALYAHEVHFGETDINSDGFNIRNNMVYFPSNIEDTGFKVKILSESDIDKYRVLINTILSAFDIFIDGYPDEEIDYSVWTDAIQEILGEPI